MKTKMSRTTSGSRSAALGAAALLLALAATPSGAAPDTTETQIVSTRSVIVRYEQKALDDDGGREALNARIEMAARGVCGPKEIKSFHARRLWKQCVDDAVNGALRQLDQQSHALLRD
jgi:UrcA family protein